MLLRRLPVLLFVAVGIWLYKSNLFPQERTLRWQTGQSRALIRGVELQLWSLEGELLKREQFALPSGAPAEVVQTVPLSEGKYDARYVIDREGSAQEAGARELRVDEAAEYVLPLGRR